jgi:hypothetical protein
MRSAIPKNTSAIARFERDAVAICGSYRSLRACGSYSPDIGVAADRLVVLPLRRGRWALGGDQLCQRQQLLRRRRLVAEHINNALLDLLLERRVRRLVFVEHQGRLRLLLAVKPLREQRPGPVKQRQRRIRRLLADLRQRAGGDQRRDVGQHRAGGLGEGGGVHGKLPPKNLRIRSLRSLLEMCNLRYPNLSPLNGVPHAEDQNTEHPINALHEEGAGQAENQRSD